MRLLPSLLLIFIGASFAAGILHLTITRVQTSQILPACTPLSNSGDYDTAQTAAIWAGQPLAPQVLAEKISPPKILGTANTSRKWIEIDLSEQKLTAYEGTGIFLETKISSGLWHKTPTGSYNIWYKIKYTKMEGGVPGTKSYYYLPNVPFAMFFKGDYGIHGTYWHTNFGRPMSHGCVNSPTLAAEKLFYWTDPQVPADKKVIRATADNPDTPVIVHD